jgi:uncharacterized protein DUF2782
MRRILFLVIAVAAASALAQQRPPKLEPLPEPPPPPLVRDGADEPRVRIEPQQGDRVEEYREGGRLMMLKVTPPNGIPYYLIDTTGSGNWMRRESLDDGVRVPMWTIRTFN